MILYLKCCLITAIILIIYKMFNNNDDDDDNSSNFSYDGGVWHKSGNKFYKIN